MHTNLTKQQVQEVYVQLKQKKAEIEDFEESLTLKFVNNFTVQTLHDAAYYDTNSEFLEKAKKFVEARLVRCQKLLLYGNLKEEDEGNRKDNKISGKESRREGTSGEGETDL